jgi:hypothetical protein
LLVLLVQQALLEIQALLEQQTQVEQTVVEAQLLETQERLALEALEELAVLVVKVEAWCLSWQK